METVRQLILVYAGVLLINLALSAVLWFRYRTALHRSLFLFWASSVGYCFVQAVPTTTPLGLSLSYLPSFVITYQLANLVAGIAEIPMPRRPYLGVVVGAALAMLALAGAGAPFWAVSLPVSVAVALPILDTPIRALRGARLTLPGKAAAFSCIFSGLHDLDYPFLRDKPQFAVLGFSIALLVVFAVSITAPATVLEKVAEERARVKQQNDFQREFFSNITHELRTPLTMILTPIEMLLSGEAGTLAQGVRTYLETMWRNGLRLLRLVNDLLDLAKLSEGFMRLRLERTDVGTILQEVVDFARPLAARKQLALDLVMEAKPADLHIDAEKMERVFVNLIANALKFTDKGGVRVVVQGGGADVRIAVEDTGLGIPEERQKDIFARFVQADPSSTRRYGGSGIGLAFAREIVELHGGRITLTSTVGQGSRFVVHLREGRDHVSPAVLDRRAPGEGSPAFRRMDDFGPREWAQGIQRRDEYRFGSLGEATDRRRVVRPDAGARAVRIMICDDNPDVLELLSVALAPQYGLLTAQNGKQGLELATRELPDLIVADFMMPEMDGLAMVRELRAQKKTADIPVIMLTSKGQIDDRSQARESGVDVYLTKPFSPRELQAAVRQQLERRGRTVAHLMRAQVEGLESVSAGLAHELHNALNYIKSGQQIIAENVKRIRGAVGTEKQGDVLASAGAKIDRMTETTGRGVQRIEGIVSLMGRYSREGYPTESTPMALDEAVRDVTALLGPKGDSECQLTVECSAPDARVLCIADEMNQVIRNLVQNAIDAAGADGKVRVGTRVESGRVVLEVADSGPGIAPEDHAKIFAPFFTTKASGMGMGLAIVQRVVTGAGGSVQIESRPGTGATFRVVLPDANARRSGRHAAL
jgi:signal transduction histidine kinase